MHWKAKARIQSAVSRIPASVSYPAYYWLQRRFGGLRTVNPERKLRAAVQTWRLILEAGRNPLGGTFFEVGTGRVPNVPMAFWLMGGERTITVDINPYMKFELIRAVLEYFAEHTETVRCIFGRYLDEKRLEQLLSLAETSSFSLDVYLEACGISYLCPGDAAATDLDDASVDFHTSRTVLEHIPPRPVALDTGRRLENTAKRRTIRTQDRLQ